MQSISTGFKSVSSHTVTGGLGKHFDSDAFVEKGDGAYFKGRLDEVQIYTLPLQDAGVQCLYKKIRWIDKVCK